MTYGNVVTFSYRMGSFTSAYTYNNGDHEDNDIKLPESMNSDDLLFKFQEEVAANMKFQRAFLRINPSPKSS